MKISAWLRISGGLMALVLVTQCALPPREAWRQVQSKGLFTFLNTIHTSPVQTPFRPDQLGGGFYRGPGPVYSGRYAQVNPTQRHNAPAPPLVPQRSVPRSTNSTPPVAASSKPKPRPATNSKPTSEANEATPRSSPSSSPKVADSAPEKKEESKPASAPVAGESLPYGRAVAGRPGLVTSPFAGSSQLVDVTGMGAGQPVKCPYTGKLFRVPAGAQARQETAE